ncbi:MAG: 23S rRNA (uracil(1939)-C(5))-methyltransferase RlmD [Defluviitaleaceae bacterium]|nr:23S rRNA (uracil(1939)-C(5))-methyltransferase RlmD [Defluviitaleaceae bacterium]
MKNKILQIQGLEYPNTGIAYFNNKKVKIKNTLPGQTVEANVRRNKAHLVRVIEPSEKEITPFCPNFSRCGGCSYQNIPYEYELELKKGIVLQLLDNKGVKGYDFLGIETGGNAPYRNKMEYSFGDSYKDGPLMLGLRKTKAYYEVINSIFCNIVDNDFTQILFFVQMFFRETEESFYNKKTHTGTLRHLVVRKGANTKEILINLVTTSGMDTALDRFVENLVALPLSAKIVGILHTINDSLSDVVQIDEIRPLYGQNFYTDTIFGLVFKIYPTAFFQTNTKGAEVLYGIVKDFVSSCQNADKNQCNDVIYDLYCGTGTIAQILSPLAKRVYGIDLVEGAIEAAKENTEFNNISNCHFFCGDVKDVVQTISEMPNIVVVDPPREGLTPKALSRVLGLGAAYIVYISCKPTSMARDINVLAEAGYKLTKLKMVDMFPRTPHIEVVGVLELL